MKKRLLYIIIPCIILAAMIAAVCINYSSFVSQTTYSESISHLSEIFRQSNSSLNKFTTQSRKGLHLWADYLQDISDDNEIDTFLEHAQSETGFTDFFFVSREGDYLTPNGGAGYLDLNSEMTRLFILTTYDWTDIEVEAKAAGVTAFCSKPMFMSDLRETLLTALGEQEVKQNNAPAA